MPPSDHNWGGRIEQTAVCKMVHFYRYDDTSRDQEGNLEYVILRVDSPRTKIHGRAQRWKVSNHSAAG